MGTFVVAENFSRTPDCSRKYSTAVFWSEENACELHFGERRCSFFFFLCSLCFILISVGTPSQAIYLSPSQVPPPLLARKNPLEHVTAASISTFFTARRRHFKYLSAAPAPSTLSQ
ncbi:UNVERIFIED_CONTAM: hypothetical protein Sindi_1061200, partial [Sesamum indicum]